MVDEAAAEPEPEPENFQRFDCTTTTLPSWPARPRLLGWRSSAGECIVLPTDTVYGIGADAFNADAVQRLLNAKNRGRDMPPPVLIADPSLIRVLAIEVPEGAKDLVARHWPGTADRDLPGPTEPADGPGRRATGRSPSGCPTTSWLARCCGGPDRWRSAAPT